MKSLISNLKLMMLGWFTKPIIRRIAKVGPVDRLELIDSAYFACLINIGEVLGLEKELGVDKDPRSRTQWLKKHTHNFGFND